MRIHECVGAVWARLPAPVRDLYYRVLGGARISMPARLFLPDRTQVCVIRGGVNGGMRMRLNIRNERGYFFGTHEYPVQSFLRRVVTPGWVAFNVGAHIGFFTLALSRLVGGHGRVVAFEPVPCNCSRLRENLDLNGVANTVVEESAIGENSGTASFSMALSDTQGRFCDLPIVKDGPIIEVEVRTIDQYAKEKGVQPDLILMDVEHAEGRVLRGAREVIRSKKPLIVMEMHGREAIKEAWEELERMGYALSSLERLERLISPLQVGYGHYVAAESSGLDRFIRTAS